MTKNKLKNISDNKTIGIALTVYGLFYIFILHEKIMMYGIDWMIMGLFGMSGLPHHFHKFFGILLIIVGIMMFMEKKPFNFLNGKK